MTKKRKEHASFSEDSVSQKRSCQLIANDRPIIPPSNQPRIDPTYGQRSAFPDFGTGHEDESLFYGPASDGLEYLQMVRSEAKTVPNLLLAPLPPTVSSIDSNTDRSQGYYADGAYTAVPEDNHREERPDEDLDPQEAYYTSLCDRFAALSATLQSSPPENIITQAIKETAADLSSPSRMKWRVLVSNYEPSMGLLSQLEQEAVIYGLKILETLLTKSNMLSCKYIGAWTWGLLARCRDVGEMGSEEVGVLRDLGKKARWAIRGITAGLKVDVEEEHYIDTEYENDINTEYEKNDIDTEYEKNDIDTEYEKNDIDTEYEKNDIDEAEQEEDEDNEKSLLNHMKNSNNEVDETVESSSPVPKSKSLQNKGLVENASELQLNPETGSDSSDPLAKAKQQILNSIEANFTQSTIPPSEGDEEKIHMKPTETFNDRTWLPDSIKHPKVDRTDARSIDQAGYPDNEDSSLYATLDMIITIVGEFYGQKDLLTGRMLWDEM